MTGYLLEGSELYDLGNFILNASLLPPRLIKYALNEDASHVDEPVLTPLVGVLTHFRSPSREVSGLCAEPYAFVLSYLTIGSDELNTFCENEMWVNNAVNNVSSKNVFIT